MRATADLGGGRTVRVDDGALEPFRARAREGAEPARVAYAAAHVVMRASYADVDHAPDAPGAPDEIATHVDWPATDALRRRLDAHGFGVAEAMDTAQRYELGWDVARVLVERTGALRLAHGFVAGAGADGLPADASNEALAGAVVAQARAIRAAGGVPMLLCLPQLPARGAGEDDYLTVYGAVVEACEGPLLVHWLGEVFHPGLAGYFPGDTFERVMALDPTKVRGCKLSLLDAAFERATRERLLAHEQVVLTGDDFHFADLVEGDDPTPTGRSTLGDRPLPLGRFSHALLGAFDGVAAPAGVALRLLAGGDVDGYRELMRPCEALGRHLFAEPTSAYKAGLAFLAWLDGHQENAMLPNHAERARDRAHLLRAVELAAEARVFTDAERVAERVERWRAGSADDGPGA